MLCMTSFLPVVFVQLLSQAVSFLNYNFNLGIKPLGF